MRYVGGRKLAVVLFKFGSVGVGSERQIESTVNLSERTFLLLFFIFPPLLKLFYMRNREEVDVKV